jgi:Domain of unknown function (DUF4376)
MSYNPYDWYWLADDARIFGSAKQIVVDDQDADYIAWTNAGNTATPWPRDDAGNQTTAALQAVLTPYNLFIDLVAYAAYARSNHAGGGLTITSISAVPFLTDPTSRNTVNSAFQYAQANPAHITNWKMSDGTFIALNNMQMATVNNDMTTFVQSCFTCESTTVSNINSGTVTTHAQVDAAFAAISNTFP